MVDIVVDTRTNRSCGPAVSRWCPSTKRRREVKRGRKECREKREEREIEGRMQRKRAVEGEESRVAA